MCKYYKRNPCLSSMLHMHTEWCLKMSGYVFLPFFLEGLKLSPPCSTVNHWGLLLIAVCLWLSLFCFVALPLTVSQKRPWVKSHETSLVLW